MSMIEIIISFAIRLSIAIMITILLTKLKYFKNINKIGTKIMTIMGVWIYSIFSSPIFSISVTGIIGGLIFDGHFSFWDCISFLGLFLTITGIVILLASQNKNIEKSVDSKMKESTDDINLF